MALLNGKGLPIIGQCESGETLRVDVGLAAGNEDLIALQFTHTGGSMTLQAVMLTPEMARQVRALLGKQLAAMGELNPVPERSQ